MQAALAQSVLEANGIAGFIIGEQTTHNLGSFAGGMGPVDVEIQVAAAQAQEAQEILAAQVDGAGYDESHQDKQDDGPTPSVFMGLNDQKNYERCPACDSEMVEMGSFTLWQKLIGLLGFGIPMFFFTPSRVCHDCKHSWVKRG
jgi:hypothetical protein